MSCRSFCFVLVWAAAWLSMLPGSFCEGNNSTSNITCSELTIAEACPLEECFVEKPASNIYFSEGDSATIQVVAKFDFFFTTFKDGVPVTNQMCDPNYCTFDADGPVLTIHSFNASFSVGSYRFSLGGACNIDFNISQAEPPSLTKENDPPTVLDQDTGPLELAPIVNHGVPPGVVQWSKDGVNISTGDVYRKEKVTASDRGIYTATIQHQTGTVKLEYEIYINFAPIITITTDPEDTNPELTNGPVKITCTAIGYPQMLQISLTSGNTGLGGSGVLGTQLQGQHYEASIEYTSIGCPDMQITCTVRNQQGMSFELTRICQKSPNVTSLVIASSSSSNTTAQLRWALDPPSASVSSYQVRYRRTDGQSNFVTISSITADSSMSYVVQGLEPGTEYEFGVSAIDSSESTESFFSPSAFFTTFREPSITPTGLLVSSRNATHVHLTWNEPSGVPSHAPIDEYEVFYFLKEDYSTPTVKKSTTNSVSITIPSTGTYVLSVRAVNRWGVSRMSAQVTSIPEIVDQSPLDLEIDLTIDISNDEVVLRWELQSMQDLVDLVTRLTILISRIESRSTTVISVPITTYNVSSVAMEQQKCFNNLNSSNTYQFCIQPYLSNGAEVLPTCKFVTTSDTNVRLSGATSCHPIVPEAVASDPVIPSWGIAVVVVSAVGLVFVFFGGCGLYFGLRRNKKEIDLNYEGHNEAFEKIPGTNNGLTGNYPYPPPQPRSASPSRNCMSYRHNSQGHHLDWQGVTAV